MSRRGIILSSLTAALLIPRTADPDTTKLCCLDPCKSTATANAGVVLVCPKGDGDPLTSAVGGVNAQITLTVRDATYWGWPGIPAEDMWLVGCNSLMLCGGSSSSNPDGPTDATGTTTFSQEPIAGGCDTGVYVVAMSTVIQESPTCLPKCLPIVMRSPDYKSAGAPGPPPCAGDIQCPDSRVSNADFSWFVTHYPTTGNPSATYLACADFAAPLGAPLGLADFSKFSLHFWGDHKCPI